MRKLMRYIKAVLSRNRYLSANRDTNNISLKGKVSIQLITAVSFFVLSVANVIQESYTMLIYTMIGFAVNAAVAVIAFKTKNEKISSYSAILFCTVTFAFFVIGGGNDGFAALWIALMPSFAMAIIDFKIGFISCVASQIFLIAVFWTPIHEALPYQYTEQFCVRFPLFFFVSVVLGLGMAVFLQKSQYEAKLHLSELQRVTEIANTLAKFDSLTGLANRRYVYEMFEKEYGNENIPHCIVMGDIDHFKTINDTYGHVVGDEVLVNVSKYITELLPKDYVKSRWGGEEFLIAANERMDCVYEQIEKLRVKISEHEFFSNGKSFNITVTFGIAEYRKKEDLNGAISLADKRLYIGKETANNSTVCK